MKKGEERTVIERRERKIISYMREIGSQRSIERSWRGDVDDVGATV